MAKSNSLVVFSGLPGTGKSTLAEYSARKYGIPLFVRDRLEASLVVSGLEFPTKRDEYPNLADAGLSLLSILAEQQLALGQSAILDCTARSQNIRNGWVALAELHNAAFLVIHCVCSDQEVHRSRIEGRKRGIPGWYELTWQHVLDSSSRFEDWKEEHIVCDSIDSLESNQLMIDEYIGV